MRHRAQYKVSQGHIILKCEMWKTHDSYADSYLSTNIKGHNDISIKLYAWQILFPGGLQSDLYILPGMRMLIRLFHYVILLHEAGWLAL